MLFRSGVRKMSRVRIVGGLLTPEENAVLNAGTTEVWLDEPDVVAAQPARGQVRRLGSVSRSRPRIQASRVRAISAMQMSPEKTRAMLR